MILLALGLVILLGLHSARIVSEDGRARLIARIGRGGWIALHSAASLIGFVLVVWGFGQARYDAPQVWTPPAALRHFNLLMMLVSLVLLSAYAFKRSHIAVAVRHPAVWAVLVWSLGHLLANGSAADLLLFGPFLVWAVADLAYWYAHDRRAGAVYPAPEIGQTAGAVALGLVLYGLLLGGLHLWLFGVPPFTA